MTLSKKLFQTIILFILSIQKVYGSTTDRHYYEGNSGNLFEIERSPTSSTPSTILEEVEETFRLLDIVNVNLVLDANKTDLILFIGNPYQVEKRMLQKFLTKTGDGSRLVQIVEGQNENEDTNFTFVMRTTTTTTIGEKLQENLPRTNRPTVTSATMGPMLPIIPDILFSEEDALNLTQHFDIFHVPQYKETDAPVPIQMANLFLYRKLREHARRLKIFVLTPETSAEYDDAMKLYFRLREAFDLFLRREVIKKIHGGVTPLLLRVEEENVVEEENLKNLASLDRPTIEDLIYKVNLNLQWDDRPQEQKLGLEILIESLRARMVQGKFLGRRAIFKSSYNNEIDGAAIQSGEKVGNKNYFDLALLQNSTFVHILASDFGRHGGNHHQTNDADDRPLPIQTIPDQFSVKILEESYKKVGHLIPHMAKLVRDSYEPDIMSQYYRLNLTAILREMTKLYSIRTQIAQLTQLVRDHQDVGFGGGTRKVSKNFFSKLQQFLSSFSTHANVPITSSYSRRMTFLRSKLEDVEEKVDFCETFLRPGTATWYTKNSTKFLPNFVSPYVDHSFAFFAQGTMTLFAILEALMYSTLDKMGEDLRAHYLQKIEHNSSDLNEREKLLKNIQVLRSSLTVGLTKIRRSGSSGGGGGSPNFLLDVSTIALQILTHRINTSNDSGGAMFAEIQTSYFDMKEMVSASKKFEKVARTMATPRAILLSSILVRPFEDLLTFFQYQGNRLAIEVRERGKNDPQAAALRQNGDLGQMSDGTEGQEGAEAFRRCLAEVAVLRTQVRSLPKGQCGGSIEVSKEEQHLIYRLADSPLTALERSRGEKICSWVVQAKNGGKLTASIILNSDYVHFDDENGSSLWLHWDFQLASSNLTLLSTSSPSLEIENGGYFILWFYAHWDVQEIQMDEQTGVDLGFHLKLIESELDDSSTSKKESLAVQRIQVSMDTIESTSNSHSFISYPGNYGPPILMDFGNFKLFSKIEYAPNERVFMWLDPKFGGGIELEPLSIDMEENYDGIQIFNFNRTIKSPQARLALTGRLGNGGNLREGEFKISKNDQPPFLLYFHSDQSVEGGGFRFSWTR